MGTIEDQKNAVAAGGNGDIPQGSLPKGRGRRRAEHEEGCDEGREGWGAPTDVGSATGCLRASWSGRGCRTASAGKINRKV